MKLICTPQWRHENYEGLQNFIKDPVNDVIVVAKSYFNFRNYEYMILTDAELEQYQAAAEQIRGYMVKEMRAIIQDSNHRSDTAQ